MTEMLVIVLKVSVGVLILAIGMGSTVSDVAYLWRRPGLLLRSLSAMYLLVPMLALALVWLFPMAPAAQAALLVIAVSGGAPLLPKKLGSLESNAYTFSLVVTSSLLAIVLVPLWVAVLTAMFDMALEISAGQVARAVAKTFLIPLGLGMILRLIWPIWAARWSDRLIKLGGLVLIVCALVLLGMRASLLMQTGWPAMAASALMLVGALAIGHLLGGPSDDDRTVLAVACCTRHIGVAILVAATFPGTRVAVMVASYLLMATLITLPYLILRRRLHAKPR